MVDGPSTYPVVSSEASAAEDRDSAIAAESTLNASCDSEEPELVQPVKAGRVSAKRKAIRRLIEPNGLTGVEVGIMAGRRMDRAELYTVRVRTCRCE